jgi:electron transport complex protein RnfG
VNAAAEKGARLRIWRSALSLTIVAVIGTALLAGVHQLTRERIAEQERRVVLRQLGQLVSEDRYDNQLQDDRFVFSDESHFPNGQTVTAYRARLEGTPVAVVLRLKAVDGYNGAIHLLVGINADGSLSGVRVVAHKETPGLGDAIEAVKSDWVLGFTGRSLVAPSLKEWAVRRDGGAFDQFTGATITPRAVVRSVKLTLEYFENHRDDLFGHSADELQVE